MAGALDRIAVPGVVPQQIDSAARRLPDPIQPVTDDRMRVPRTNQTSQVPASMTPFGPESTLRGTQIAPGADPNLNIPRHMVNQQVGGLAGPDRGAIAQDVLERLIQRTRPQYEQELRGVNQAAAAGGRLGSGLTTSRLGDVASNRQEFLADAAARLSSEAARETLNDRRSVLDTLTGLENMRFNQGVTGREEMRGERGYQDQLARLAHGNEIQRILMEDQLLNSAFGRDQDRLRLLLSGGFGGSDPSSTLLAGAGNLNQQAGASGDAITALLFETALRGNT